MIDEPEPADALVRGRLEEVLYEIKTMVRPFKDDGGYAGRVHALISERTAEIASDDGLRASRHPLYDPNHRMIG